MCGWKFAYEPNDWIEATTPGAASRNDAASSPLTPALASAPITRRSASYAARESSESSDRSRSNRPRSAFGIVNTTCRCATGAAIPDRTRSARTVERFAWHDAHRFRVRQENASRCSSRQVPHRIRAKPPIRRPQSRYWVTLRPTTARSGP